MLRLRAAILTSLGLFLVGVLSSAAEPDLSQEELSATYESSDIDDAIEKSIQYLLTAQEQDGAFRQKPRERRNEAAMTSLAMLAFSAAGHQPVDPTEEGKALLKALEFMLEEERQEDDGYFGKRDGSRMYGHGIVTLMLAEMLGMAVDDEQDELIRTKCRKAVELILRAQKLSKPAPKQKGGWRYNPDSRDSDISVTVWQVMALRAAQNAGIHVPKWAIDDAIDYLKACHKDESSHDKGRQQKMSGCAYQPGHGPKFSTAAAGMLAFQVCGGYELPEVRAAADGFKKELIKPNNDYLYYGLYYYAQGMYQRGGEYEEVAASVLEREMMPQQDRDGSWRAKGGQETQAGRIYTTSLAVMTLAVNYHYLPIYQR